MQYHYMVKCIILDEDKVLYFKYGTFKQAYDMAKHIITMGDLAILSKI